MEALLVGVAIICLIIFVPMVIYDVSEDGVEDIFGGLIVFCMFLAICYGIGKFVLWIVG